MKLLRIEEVAAALRVSFQAVKSAIATGNLVTVKVGARGARVREEELTRLFYLQLRLEVVHLGSGMSAVLLGPPTRVIAVRAFAVV